MSRRCVGWVWLGLGAGLSLAAEVPQWSRVEVSLSNDQAYTDPFRDVTLAATLTGPDGRRRLVSGFHDGGSTWRLRMLADRVGNWTYVARFSDGRPAGTGGFTVVASDRRGPLDRDSCQALWFGYRSGRHAVLRSLHVGDRFFAANWPAAQRRRFLDWAQAQGYNCLSAASFFLNRDVPGRGRGWDTPDLWDGPGRRPRPEAYRRVEALLDELDARGIAVYPFAGFFGQSADFPLDPNDQDLYLRYTVARFGAYGNLLFNVAGPEPLLRPDAFRGAMTAGDIIRLGRRIAALDPYGHLLSVHNQTGPDPFRHEPWTGYVTLQGGKEPAGPSVYSYIEQARVHGGKPVFAQEVFWPGNKYHSAAVTQPDQIRRKALLLLCAGAAINFADMDGNSSSGFSGSLDPADAHPERHAAVKAVWDWFEALPFYRYRPLRRAARNGFVLADEGLSYVVYTLDGTAPLSLDLAAARGDFRLTWIDALSFRAAGETRVVSAGEVVSLGPPPAPAGRDWLARLDRVAPPVFRPDADGVIRLEAEEAVAVKDWVEVPGRQGRALRDAGARGEGYLLYPVTVERPGRYWLYGLLRRTDAEHADRANDAFVTLAGRPLTASDGVTHPDGFRCSRPTFTWQSLPKGPGAHTPRSIFHGPIYADIPAPGTYPLRIGSRSPGLEVDALALSPRPEAPAAP